MHIGCSRDLITAAAATIVTTALFAVAPPAAAEPPEDPCALAISVFCRFVPIAPELEHSVDLTRNQPPADPAAPLPESNPIPDICAYGCV